MMSIKQLEREIERLKADVQANRRYENRAQTQANYQESSQPELSFASEQLADKYHRDVEKDENLISNYQTEINQKKEEVSSLQQQADELRRQADEKDRQAMDILG